MNEIMDRDLLSYNNEQQVILQKVINSKNFPFIRRLFQDFFYYKGYKLGQNTWNNLYTDLYLEFYMDKRIFIIPNNSMVSYSKQLTTSCVD